MVYVPVVEGFTDGERPLSLILRNETEGGNSKGKSNNGVALWRESLSYTCIRGICYPKA